MSLISIVTIVSALAVYSVVESSCTLKSILSSLERSQSYKLNHLSELVEVLRCGLNLLQSVSDSVRLGNDLEDLRDRISTAAELRRIAWVHLPHTRPGFRAGGSRQT
jgi:hypothetical protein